MSKVKNHMVKVFKDEIGELDYAEIDRQIGLRDGARQKIKEAQEEVAALEGELEALPPLGERFNEALEAGTDLDEAEEIYTRIDDRIKTLAYRIETLEGNVKKLNVSISLAHDNDIATVEGALDRTRVTLGEELAALLQPAENFHAVWKDTLKEVLKANNLTVQSFPGRPEDSLAVLPTWNPDALPLTLWVIPNWVTVKLDRVPPKIVKIEEEEETDG